MNVSRSSVQRAKAVKEADPEKFEEVKAGKTTLNAALKAVKPEPEPEPEPKVESTESGDCEDHDCEGHEDPWKLYRDPKNWFKTYIFLIRFLDDLIPQFEFEELKLLTLSYHELANKLLDHFENKFGAELEEHMKTNREIQ